MKMNPSWRHRLAVLLGVSTLMTGALTAAAADLYWLYTLNHLQKAEVFLNGFPLKEMPGTNAFTVNTILDPFLVAGTNRFVIVSTNNANTLTADDIPELRLRLDYGGEEATNRQAIFEWDRKAELQSGKLTETYEMAAGPQFQYATRGLLDQINSVQEINLGAKEVKYRFETNATGCRASLNFTLAGPRLTTLPWQGTTVVLTGPDRSAITALVQATYSALTNKDVAALQTLMTNKVQRVATALASPLATEVNKLSEFYNSFINDPTFALNPLDSTKLQFKTYPDCSVVQVLVNDAFPIQGKGDQFVFKLPMYCAKVGGQWLIVE